MEAVEQVVETVDTEFDLSVVAQAAQGMNVPVALDPENYGKVMVGVLTHEKIRALIATGDQHGVDLTAENGEFKFVARTHQ